MSNYSPEEREILILTSDADDYYRVASFSSRAGHALVRRLATAMGTKPAQWGHDGISVDVPKSELRISIKRKLNLTDEQRAERAERLAKARNANKD